MENIKELLRKAEESADLRKKETLRLIDASKKVLQEIAKLNLYGDIDIEKSEYEGYVDITYLRALNGKIDVGIYTLEHFRQFKEKRREDISVIVFDATRYTLDRIPGKNQYGIPENYPLRPHTSDISPQDLFVNFYPEPRRGAIKVNGKWFSGLPFHEKEPDTISRSLWILVAHHIVELAENIAERETKKLTETVIAKKLSEKLSNAIS